jgi:hypothetical protein
MFREPAAKALYVVVDQKTGGLVLPVHGRRADAVAFVRNANLRQSNVRLSSGKYVDRYRVETFRWVSKRKASKVGCPDNLASRRW